MADDDTEGLYARGLAQRGPRPAPSGGGYRNGSNGGRIVKAAYGGRVWEGSAQDRADDHEAARQRGIPEREWEGSGADRLHDEARLAAGGRAPPVKRPPAAAPNRPPSAVPLPPVDPHHRMLNPGKYRLRRADVEPPEAPTPLSCGGRVRRG